MTSDDVELWFLGSAIVFVVFAVFLAGIVILSAVTKSVIIGTLLFLAIVFVIGGGGYLVSKWLPR